MSVYAMSDLHLALSADKPMDVFGGRWNDYMERIMDNWNSLVSDEDTVLIGGDVSWAMYLGECKADFDYIEALNGTKIISKGNHDYWWESITKLNKYLADGGYKSIHFLHNNSYIVQDYGICGARGWTIPGSDSFKADDLRLYERELGRLELSAQDMDRHLQGRDLVRVAMLHYPPVDKDGVVDPGFADVMQRYGISLCLYGHLHSHAAAGAFNGVVGGTEYRLVSSDYMNFIPYKLNFRK